MLWGSREEHQQPRRQTNNIRDSATHTLFAVYHTRTTKRTTSVIGYARCHSRCRLRVYCSSPVASLVLCLAHQLRDLPHCANRVSMRKPKTISLRRSCAFCRRTSIYPSHRFLSRSYSNIAYRFVLVSRTIALVISYSDPSFLGINGYDTCDHG